MKMKIKTLLLISAALIVFVSAGANARVRVVASTSDLASIAEMIAGDHAKCEAIVTGKKDPHFVEVLPSYMVKVARADVYLQVGGDLDYWANQIIDGSQNGKLLIVDCSKNIEFLERPMTRIDASMGDIHRQGNPHYWLDPENGKTIAQTITDALKAVDPDNSADYDAGLERFRETIDGKIEAWGRFADALQGMEIITYHNSWPYFCRAFGIKVVGFVEPKPGIEPTPSHTAKLISMINAGNIRIIGKEPYFSNRTPDSIARQTGATVVNLPPSVGGAKEATDYFTLFDTLLSILVSSLEES
jgi:ABC-type Zn uptake system ZnuABC Zn-binding protein ZnuA